MIDLIGFGVGLTGLIVAVYQTYSAQRARRLYRNGCRIRSRDAADKAQRLADNVAQLCAASNSSNLSVALTSGPASAKAYAELSSHLGAVLDVAKDWVRFCLRLNEEHQDEFKESALTDEQLRGLQAVKNCLTAVEAEHLHSVAETRLEAQVA